MIPSKILKTSENGIQWIKDILNKSGDKGKVPKEWNMLVISFIFKKVLIRRVVKIIEASQ